MVVVPPFFEYSLATPWSDKSQNHRFAIWEENEEVVAFCWYEGGLGEAYFNISEGYDFLISEMIEHAEKRLKDDDGKLQLKINATQKNVLGVAIQNGYQVVYSEKEGMLDFSEVQLNYSLPQGYMFELPGQYDMEKMVNMTWRGFDNLGEPYGGVERGYHTGVAPNATPELDVLIKTQEGEYVCYAGMWWVPQNRLAYLEPLCTVPEHRGKGLARAALTELYRRTLKLGATHMTGGTNEFYFKIGYKVGCETLFLEKNA